MGPVTNGEQPPGMAGAGSSSNPAAQGGSTLTVPGANNPSGYDVEAGLGALVLGSNSATTVVGSNSHTSVTSQNNDANVRQSKKRPRISTDDADYSTAWADAGRPGCSLAEEAVRGPLVLRPPSRSWAEQVSDSEEAREIVNKGAGPSIPNAVQGDYRALRNAESKKARYVVRLETLNRYIGLGVTPRSHTLNVDPMFGMEDNEFCTEWEEIKRRAETEMTNLLVRRAQITIGECEATISASQQKVADKCTHNDQICEISSAILAVKQKVIRQEKQFRADKLARDRELHRLRLDKGAKSKPPTGQPAASGSRSGNARRGGQPRQPQTQRQPRRQATQQRGRQQGNGQRREAGRGNQRQDSLREMELFMNQMKKLWKKR